METIRVQTQGQVTTITLNRPDVRNAFNEGMIAELTQAFATLPEASRVVVLAAAGDVFCAGADVTWMKKSRNFTEAENARDAAAMAAMFRALDECPKPVIGRIQGQALGGACGLVACCDVAIAVEEAQFGFSEVRLGIVPAVISTFVLDAIGPRNARRYFVTGERFGAAAAKEMGLVHEVVKPEALDARVQEVVGFILQSGPCAVTAAKQIIREVRSRPRDVAIGHAVGTIARLRVSPEAQEGLDAFLGKRKPKWAWMES